MIINIKKKTLWMDKLRGLSLIFKKKGIYFVNTCNKPVLKKKN